MFRVHTYLLISLYNVIYQTTLTSVLLISYQFYGTRSGCSLHVALLAHFEAFWLAMAEAVAAQSMAKKLTAAVGVGSVGRGIFCNDTGGCFL